jgi:hypothetical protein
MRIIHFILQIVCPIANPDLVDDTSNVSIIYPQLIQRSWTILYCCVFVFTRQTNASLPFAVGPSHCKSSTSPIIRAFHSFKHPQTLRQHLSAAMSNQTAAEEMGQFHQTCGADEIAAVFASQLGWIGSICAII